MVRQKFLLVMGVALITLMSGNLVLAAGPEDSPGQGNGRRAGLTSSLAECLVVQAGTPDSVSATVYLEWEGQVEEAFLALAVAGSERGHSIYVNGQRVGSAPVRPDGQPCQRPNPAIIVTSTDVISVPPEVLLNGENVITITNDADINDSWAATNVHLEIQGILSLPLAPPPEHSPQAPSGLGTMALETNSVVLSSSYDGQPHTVWYQVPDVYDGTPLPLLVGIHGWGGTGGDMVSFMGEAVNTRGWLYVAPNMHGNYYLDGRQALAWPGAQHDILDAIEYMQANYNVDSTHIYITGPSMGGLTTTTMAAKYPDIFVAAAEWSGITDLADWYNNELTILNETWMKRQIESEVLGNASGGNPDPLGGPGSPGYSPFEDFEYQRRSAMAMPQNSRLIPLKLWHNEADNLVAVYHAYDLRDAINDNWMPPLPVALHTETVTGCGDGGWEHCYGPPFEDVFDFLDDHTLDTAPPLSLTIRTDESKPYYWLNIDQANDGAYWSEVAASYTPGNKTVIATISDTHPLTVAFNLGSIPIAGRADILQSGLGLSATTYLIREEGNSLYSFLDNYTSGYLTATLSNTGQFSLTVSAIESTVSASPTQIESNGSDTSTITVVVTDQLGNPIPDNTDVEFTTTLGTFPNGTSTDTATTTGGTGQATLVLTSGTTDGLAQIVAQVESISNSTSVVIGIVKTVYLPILIKNN